MKRMLLVLAMMLLLAIPFSAASAFAETYYTITYDANGGENAPVAQKKEHGKYIYLSHITPTREEYDFVGWSTSKDASSAEYYSQSIFTKNADTTLYAVWTRAIVASGYLNGTRWKLDVDGLLTISGSGEMERLDFDPNRAWQAEKDSIKSVVIEQGVTSICNSAFYCCSNLTNVSLPETITSIGDNAFTSCGLTSLIIPESVESIGGSAFLNCQNITSLTIPANVKNIGIYAFSKCIDLRNVTILGNLQSLGDNAFSSCSNLKSVAISGNVEKIGNSAFSRCSQLESVTIPASVTSISVSAFEGCAKLTSAGPFDSDCNFKFGWTDAIPNYAAFPDSLTSVVLPEGIRSIGDYSFAGTALTSIDLLESVENIGAGAFAGCNKLTSVTIPKGVKRINHETFLDCSSLTSVTILSEGTKVDIAFSGCDKLKTAGPIGSGCNFQFAWTDMIPNNAFSCLYSLTDVILPESVKSIGAFAFNGCRNLKNVTIPKQVENIGSAAFAGCNSLTSLQIPESVQVIGDSAFGSCYNLEKINIPEQVTRIEDYTFSGCSKLTNITVPPNVTSIGYGAFSFCQGLTNFTVPSGVTDIRSETFYECGNMESITIPASVMNIEDYAFSNCTNLVDIYFRGTTDQWKTINIGAGNTCLTDAAVHCMYTLSIDGNIAHGTVTAEKGNFAVNDTVTLTVTPDTGYELDTLTVKQGETALTVTDNSFIMPEGDVTVSATFKPIAYTITWKNDDGSLIDETQVEYGTIPAHADAEKAATAEFTYTFTGWTPAITAVTGDASYTATFTAQRILYTVTFDANGGGKGPEAQEKGAGLELILSSAIPEREEEEQSIPVTLNANGGMTGGSVNPRRMTAARYTSYRFESWNTEADGTGTGYAPGAVFTADKDTTLYAQWSAETEDAPVSLPIPTREGFLFLGWVENADAQRGFAGDYMPESKITLYALWDIPDFTLPAALTEIGAEAFAGGAFRFAALSDKTRTIGSRAFADCPQLTAVYIPGQGTVIDTDAFGELENLTVLGLSGSFADRFAKEHHFSFIPIV